MTLPFFGSGMVEIPPDGYKRMKNSRKMQMVFFVHEGKVTVDIEDVQFGMTKGGVWQVPRGESFSISFSLHPSPSSVCISCFAFCEGTAVRNVVFTATMHLHVQYTPTYVKVTLGNTCLCSIMDRCQNRVFTTGFLYHKQSETWGTATLCEPWYWEYLEDRHPTGCG